MSVEAHMHFAQVTLVFRGRGSPIAHGIAEVIEREPGITVSRSMTHIPSPVWSLIITLLSLVSLWVTRSGSSPQDNHIYQHRHIRLTSEHEINLWVSPKRRG